MMQPFSRAVGTEPIAAQQDALFGLKERLLNEVRAAAAATGEKPTLEQYRMACQTFSLSEEGVAATAAGVWGPRIYADLSGQDLSGLTISDPTGHTTKRPATNLMDLDGDGAIGDFYTNISFYEANLKDAFIDPATSFNADIAKAKTIDGLTFNGMQNGDIFTFAAGQYTNIKMTNINGGELIFAGGTKVDGLNISGVHANVRVNAHASISHITVDDNTRILTLKMGKGALISHSDLRDATIPPSSELRDTLWQDVKIGANCSHVDFGGASFNRVTFDKTSLKNTSFAGTSLNTVEFKDINQAELDLSGVKDFNNVKINGVVYPTLQSFEMGQKIAAAGVKSFAWDPAQANTAPAIEAPAQAVGPSQAPASRSPIIGGESVGFDTLSPGGRIANMARTVPVTEQASGANMSRSSK